MHTNPLASPVRHIHKRPPRQSLPPFGHRKPNDFSNIVVATRLLPGDGLLFIAAINESGVVPPPPIRATNFLSDQPSLTRRRVESKLLSTIISGVSDKIAVAP